MPIPPEIKCCAAIIGRDDIFVCACAYSQLSVCMTVVTLSYGIILTSIRSTGMTLLVDIMRAFYVRTHTKMSVISADGRWHENNGMQCMLSDSVHKIPFKVISMYYLLLERDIR